MGDHWKPDELRHEAKTLRRLGKENQFETPYGMAETATYGYAAEGMEWAADEIERLTAELEAADDLHERDAATCAKLQAVVDAVRREAKDIKHNYVWRSNEWKIGNAILKIVGANDE